MTTREPEEYAVGEELTEEFRNSEPGIRVSIRLSSAEAKALLAEAGRQGLTFTELAEELIRSSLTAQER